MNHVHRHLTGAGRFIADEALPGMGHMVVLRADVAHGVIAGLDVAEARAMPGVRTVLTAEELAREGIGRMGCREVVEGINGPMIEPRRPVLAEGKVVHVGQPIAAIVADTEAEAQSAAEAVEIDIDPLPAVIDPTTATEAPAIWPEAPDNRALIWEGGNVEETKRLTASAAHVVEVKVEHPRIAISPIETRGCLGDWQGGQYTLITPSQGVVSLRHAMAEVLGCPVDAMRVVTHDVGGSFAVKIWPYGEQVLVLLAARLTGAPVRWIGSRAEAFTGDAAGRARVDRGRLALDAEGRFLAVQIEATADMGAFLNRAAPSIQSAIAVGPFAQVYDIPGQHYRVEQVFTNAVPTDAYRGAGKPETTGTLERLIEVAAQRLGVDPFELRRRNLIQPQQIPYATPMGNTIDAGDFPALAARVAEAGDWAGLGTRKAISAQRGLLRGGAIGFNLHISGGSTAERSEVRAMPDGTVRVRTGSQDSGQSHHASLARVAARALDVDVDRIVVEQGDTAWLEQGGGTGGSNLMPVAGQTVHRTALQMLERARVQAGAMLEAAEADLEYGGGTFRIVGTDRMVSLTDIAVAMEEHDEGGCMAQLDFAGQHFTWPNGGFACEVEVDPDTGAMRLDRLCGVTDIGEVINGPAALGQIYGSVGQGLGEALMEGMAFDGDGQPLTGSMMDYGLPRADDLVMIGHEWAPTDSPHTVINAKGVGELASIGVPSVIVNAVHDALAPFGVENIQRPITPVKIWQALELVKASSSKVA